MTVGGTQAEYVVDIWSGNHPFFLGKSTAIMTNAGRVSRFGDRFGDLGALSLPAQPAAAAETGVRAFAAADAPTTVVLAVGRFGRAVRSRRPFFRESGQLPIFGGKIRRKGAESW